MNCDIAQDVTIAKTDMAIAGAYADLVEDKSARDAIFGRIQDGWLRTVECLLDIRGETRLLEKNPALDSSIRLRLPYIEPLNLLQIELLKRHRAGEDDPRIREGIQLSINLIATALRNSAPASRRPRRNNRERRPASEWRPPPCRKPRRPKISNMWSAKDDMPPLAVSAARMPLAIGKKSGAPEAPRS